MPKASVFLSYASEDSGFVTTFYEGLSVLNGFAFSNIDIFFDRAVIAAGQALTDTIMEVLNRTDFLVLFLAGTQKPSHSYTGIEVGYFLALQKLDVAKHGKSERRIIPLFWDQLPDPYRGLIGIDITLPGNEVALPIEQFRALLGSHGAKAQQLAGLFGDFFSEIALLAEDRYAREKGGLEVRERITITEKRVNAIRNEIVPSVMDAVYNWSRSRITRSRIEQYLIEFEFSDDGSKTDHIADDAHLLPHGGSLEIFGLRGIEAPLSWGEFKDRLRKEYAIEAVAIIDAVERCVTSSVRPDRDIDNEQIFRDPRDNGRVYRMIVTRQYSFHDGRSIVDMYVLDLLHLLYTANQETTNILAFLNIAVKYRTLFVNWGATFSPQTVSAEVGSSDRKPEEVRDFVRRFMQQLIIIEDEGRVLGFNDLEQLSNAIGQLPQAELELDTAKWKATRGTLQQAADALLVERDLSKLEDMRVEWERVQKAFAEVAGGLNSRLGVRAVERLRSIFTRGTLQQQDG